MSTAADWSMDRSVAEMTEAGAFGSGSRFVSFALDNRHTGNDQFASSVFYGTVTVEDGGGRVRHRLVIKLKHQMPEMRALFKNDPQFHNETLFYERILPFLLAGVPEGVRAPSLCRYFYGRNDCGDRAFRDMVVLENATYRGYGPARSPHRLFLDSDHLVVAMTALAKFHGLSYRAKHADPAKFMEMVSAVKETQWDDENLWNTMDSDTFGGLLSVILDRLAERHGSEDCVRRFRTELLDDSKRTLRCAMEADEPFAVLCHGDFNRNNMLFRYDDGNRPVDALPFDMATVRYGSPALDISFFLYMNTDRRTRDAHWDELLDVYCSTLTASVSDLTGVIRVPDRAQLDAELRERAFYGLAHVSFFLRVMMEEQIQFDPTIFINGVSEENIKLFLTYGGDKATDVIADVVQHFIDIKYAERSS